MRRCCTCANNEPTSSHPSSHKTVTCSQPQRIPSNATRVHEPAFAARSTGPSCHAHGAPHPAHLKAACRWRPTSWKRALSAEQSAHVGEQFRRTWVGTSSATTTHLRQTAKPSTSFSVHQQWLFTSMPHLHRVSAARMLSKRNQYQAALFNSPRSGNFHLHAVIVQFFDCTPADAAGACKPRLNAPTTV